MKISPVSFGKLQFYKLSEGTGVQVSSDGSKREGGGGQTLSYISPVAIELDKSIPTGYSSNAEICLSFKGFTATHSRK